MENEQPEQPAQAEQLTFVESVLEFIEQLVSPDWPGLIALVPLLFIGLIGLFLLLMALQWRRAARLNSSRVPRRLAAGAPPPGVHLPGPSRWPFVLPIGVAMVLFGLVLPVRDEAGQVVVPLNLPLLGIGLAVTLLAIGGWLIDAMREWRAQAYGAQAVAGVLAPGASPTGHLAAGAVGHAARPAVATEPPVGVHMPGPSPWPFFAPLGVALILFGLILSWALVLGGLLLAVIAAAGWYREASHEYRSTEQVGHAVPVTRDPERAWPRRLVPVFLAILGVSLIVALAPLGLQWLGGLAPPADGEQPPAVPEVAEIVARSAVSYETDTLVVPCCRDFELIFHNEHDGVPHDVDISDDAGGTTLFDGEIITGPDEITYSVPALDEGDYYFFCSVHPNMNGTVQSRPEEGGPAPEGGEED
ncbi:MAG TPA: hypothetical protein VMP67_00715 [Candidatus Limnocylindria bacterium]|nr:hypothetical protein [Candidatus Limnocylindria bacterium]